MKYLRSLQWMLTLSLLLLFSNALALESPIGMLQKVSDKMLAFLNQHKSELRKNKSIIFTIVDEVLVPNIDTDRMAGLVVGRQYWEKATPAQRGEFVQRFKHMVVSTYANALASYDDDRVRFYPLRGNFGRTVQVNSVIVRKTGQQIPINYNLIQSSNGWKVYDFSVENVSIVQNYRSQFAGLLARGGLPALLQQMRVRAAR